ncbi:GNAT family N-acetyltransferase [Sediminibacillus halophilus]|uniref:N-acetylglutamate synthase, GNAT family n=1 Tax=Sediminibacillus halophilus TaxID=482461 RepID=A0A1G9WTQ3_9BACI|nr:GNAT family N-acetyltransferase [Sediminibacillus halophilus]SDM87545.1 N-acetylglutamate synthase, GNAT family [Sediminibacillus halophilus]
MIRKAEKKDLERIMEIVKASVEVMNRQGNYQWDHTYPLPSHYQGDIVAGDLYVAEQDGRIVGAACLSEKEHDEYPSVDWRSPAKALTVKRVAVDPQYRGLGIATGLYQHAEKVAKQKGLDYIKTDTFSKNASARHLFEANGYHYLQEKYVEEKNDSLRYYDKIL